MTTLTSETTFNIAPAPETFEDQVDLYLFPENQGVLAMRELHHPAPGIPVFVYEENPDKWDNFDTEPMTDRPQVKTTMTLSWAQSAQWKGYLPDRPVKEVWTGTESQSRMTPYMLRRLYEFLVNTPAPCQYITWWPKDRTTKGYKILIESLTVGGSDAITFDNIATRNGFLIFEVAFQFRIVGEADA